MELVCPQAALGFGPIAASRSPSSVEKGQIRDRPLPYAEDKPNRKAGVFRKEADYSPDRTRRASSAVAIGNPIPAIADTKACTRAALSGALVPSGRWRLFSPTLPCPPKQRLRPRRRSPCGRKRKQPMGGQNPRRSEKEGYRTGPIAVPRYIARARTERWPGASEWRRSRQGLGNALRHLRRTRCAAQGMGSSRACVETCCPPPHRRDQASIRGGQWKELRDAPRRPRPSAVAACSVPRLRSDLDDHVGACVPADLTRDIAVGIGVENVSAIRISHMDVDHGCPASTQRADARAVSWIVSGICG